MHLTSVTNGQHRLTIIRLTTSCYQIVDNRATYYWLPATRKVVAVTRPRSTHFHNFAASISLVNTKITLNFCHLTDWCSLRDLIASSIHFRARHQHRPPLYFPYPNLKLDRTCGYTTEILYQHNCASRGVRITPPYDRLEIQFAPYILQPGIQRSLADEDEPDCFTPTMAEEE